MGVKVLRELVRSGNLLGEFFNFFFFLSFGWTVMLLLLICAREAQYRL